MVGVIVKDISLIVIMYAVVVMVLMNVVSVEDKESDTT